MKFKPGLIPALVFAGAISVAIQQCVVTGEENTPSSQGSKPLPPHPQLKSPAKASAPGKGEVFLFVIDKMPSGQLISLYGEATGRVILYGPQVALTERISLREADPSTSKEKKLDAIKEALKAKGIVLRESGEQFLFAINPEVTKQLPEVVVRPLKAGDEGKSADPLTFEYSPASQVLDVYATLTGRKWDSKRPLPYFITLRTSGVPLTKMELIAALEVAFELRGLKITHGENDSFSVTEIKPAASPSR